MVTRYFDTFPEPVTGEDVLIAYSPTYREAITFGSDVQSAYLYVHQFKDEDAGLDYVLNERYLGPGGVAEVNANPIGGSVTFSNIAGLFNGGAGNDEVSYRLTDNGPSKPGALYYINDAQSTFNGGDGDDTMTFNFGSLTHDLIFESIGTSGHVNGIAYTQPVFDAPDPLIDINYSSFEHLTIRSGSGNDLIQGGDGSDRIYAGASNDIILAGQGKDVIYGGAGADRFVFDPGDSGIGGANRDYIADFQTGVDRIDLETSGEGTQVSFQTSGDTTIVRVSPGNDGVADFQIQVHGTIALSDIFML